MTLELLMSAALAAGFFGSGHCFGMCGPVVVLLEGHDTATPHYRLRRLLYNIGRLSFYMLLGLVAGATGTVLTTVAGADIALMALRLIAALLVIAIGVNLVFLTRVFSFLEKGGAVIWRRMAPLAKQVLPISSPASALGAGFIWGALPCGLVYSSVAIAASSGRALDGAAIMFAFWLGTLPALLLAGSSVHKLSGVVHRPLLRRIAGLLLIAAGIAAILIPYLHSMSGEGGHQHAAQEYTMIDSRSTV